MPTALRQKRYFDRSSLVAYAGAGAAIVFIMALTFGAIDAPSDVNTWVAASSTAEATHLVSTAPDGGAPRIR